MFIFRYCPNCKNDDTEIVKAGEKLKESKKKAKMASTTSTSNRDWGRVRNVGLFGIAVGVLQVKCLISEVSEGILWLPPETHKS